MPQFDKITFLNQILWLFLFFFCIYSIFLKIFLPRIAFLLKLRAKKLLQGSTLANKINDEIAFNNSTLREFIFKYLFFLKNINSNFLFANSSWLFLQLKSFPQIFKKMEIFIFLTNCFSCCSFSFKNLTIREIHFKKGQFSVKNKLNFFFKSIVPTKPLFFRKKTLYEVKTSSDPDICLNPIIPLNLGMSEATRKRLLYDAKRGIKTKKTKHK